MLPLALRLMATFPTPKPSLCCRARVKAEPAAPAEEATPGRPDLGDLRQRAAARLSGAHAFPSAANGGAPAPPAGRFKYARCMNSVKAHLMHGGALLW
jgi:hypothetical protein